MDLTEILLTNITVQGSFYDMSLYSGFLYLWKNKREVSLFHWDKWIKQLAIEDLPIYQDRITNQVLHLKESDLQPFLIKTLSFDYDVRDSFVFRHRLYFIDDLGFYVMQPESADTSKTLLIKGNFHALAINHTNRIMLASKVDGVFEWHGETVIPWDTTPTADILWSGENLLQLDDKGGPVQLLNFEVHNKEAQLLNRIPAEKLHPAAPYYETSLNLGKEEEEDCTISLFGFLPHTDPTASKAIGDQVMIAAMPHPSLPAKTLDDQTLYILEHESGLNVQFRGASYFSIPWEDYLSFRVYHKSRHYKNQLHLVSDGQISFFIFNRLL